MLLEPAAVQQRVQRMAQAQRVSVEEARRARAPSVFAHAHSHTVRAPPHAPPPARARQVLHALVSTSGDFERAAWFLGLSKGSRCVTP